MITVIVPIYNMAAYLDQCIQSICAQTYQDLEIILVDDGSADGSGAICGRYGEKDRRIRVIHKPNGGLVSARKAGLQAASGAFIGWVDADDWVEPSYFEQMVRAQMESDADIVAAGHFHDIGTDSRAVFNGVPPGTYNRAALLPRLIYSGKFFEYGLQPHVYTKLIRKEILDQTQMAVDERICAGEDAAVVYPSVLKADRIMVTDICGYHYVQHPGSITKSEEPDELTRVERVINHLEQSFVQANAAEVMAPQLAQYRKYMLLLRQIKALDQKILLPFGGIPLHSRVVIYGAGVLGQKIYRYLLSDGAAEVLLWLDQNYQAYRQNGAAVNAPETIRGLNGQYDYVLIANTAASAAHSIRNRLLALNVPAEKIRWLSGEFIRC